MSSLVDEIKNQQPTQIFKKAPRPLVGRFRWTHDRFLLDLSNLPVCQWRTSTISISTKGSKKPAFFFFGYEWSQRRRLLPVNKLHPERHKIATLPVFCMVKLIWPAVGTCALYNLMARMGPTYRRSFSSPNRIHLGNENPWCTIVFLGYI